MLTQNPAFLPAVLLTAAPFKVQGIGAIYVHILTELGRKSTALLLSQHCILPAATPVVGVMVYPLAMFQTH